MNNVMLDIETLGTSKNAAIISIGAVFFNPATGELGNEFYKTIRQDSCETIGLEVDASTLKWWSEQSEEARAVLNCPNATHIALALNDFYLWIKENTTATKHVEIWGNGSSFDCAIVDNAYRRCAINLPWRYANERDVRTIVALGRELLQIDPKYDFPFVGTAHNALADAKHQATYVSHIYQALAAKCGGAA
ncbi:MAG TPA: 3'-5' exoribonuclease [Rheinheimera sp.]|uniref:3'-5' exonuclease n=1 Tax=Rheinheimera sp. TaxID=1869214 RepID=UPI000EBD3857|nr:3'-5' exonuclease [Rheinheimera sp.]HCU66192.1 3'-5' exoribonuclease [Rheinheimera sp.]